MTITLQVLGTRGEIEEYSKDHYSQTALLLKGEKKVLIDYGEVQKTPLEEIDPRFIILTHLHPDHAGGLKSREVEVPVYVEGASWEIRDPKELEEFWFPPHLMEGKSWHTLWEDLELQLIPTLHSPYYPSSMVWIKGEASILYTGDTLDLDRGLGAVLKSLDFYIGDGSFLRRGLSRKTEKGDVYGHTSIKSQLQCLAKAGFKGTAIFVHFGKEAVEMGDEKLEGEMEEMRAELGINFRVVIARDNDTFKLKKTR